LNTHRHWILFALFFLLPAIAVGQGAPGTETVLVLPFDNSTHQPGLEWISEAFPEVLGQRLNTQSLFLISRDDRQYAFDRIGIPVNLHASRATLYQIAAQFDADYILLGSFSYDGQAFTARAQVLGTAGEYAWGGAASTAFWIDPAEEMSVVLLTQLTPSSTYPIRRELRVLTYQAIID